MRHSPSSVATHPQLPHPSRNPYTPESPLQDYRRPKNSTKGRSRSARA